jgi:hypothetical protein
METIYSSEMLVCFQRTTRRYIPEDSILHNHLVRTPTPTKHINSTSNSQNADAREVSCEMYSWVLRDHFTAQELLILEAYTSTIRADSKTNHRLRVTRNVAFCAYLSVSYMQRTSETTTKSLLGIVFTRVFFREGSHWILLPLFSRHCAPRMWMAYIILQCYINHKSMLPCESEGNCM